MSQLDASAPKYARRALWKAEKQEQARYYGDRVRELKKGREAGKRRQALQRDFFRDPKVKLAAITKACKGKVSRNAVHSLAAELNLFAPQDHVVRTYERPKASGGTRTICVLPPLLKAKHRMIKSALEVELIREPTMFGVKSFGREEAAQYIQQLQNVGFDELGQTDITNCFASFNLDALYNLPLPQGVISHSLDTRKQQFSFQALHSNTEAKKGASPDTPSAPTPVTCMAQGHDEGGIDIGSSSVDIACNTRGPQGLMQGSPASNAILAWHLNEILKGYPPTDEAQVVICFDNLLIIGRTKEAVRAIWISLADSLGRCSPGPLTLHDLKCADPEFGLEFLGYNHPPSGAEIKIGEKAQHRMLCRLNKLEQRFEKSNWRDPEAVTFELWNILLDYAAGYSGVTNIHSELVQFIEASAWIPEASDDPLLMHLHWRLFERQTPTETAILKSIRGMK